MAISTVPMPRDVRSVYPFVGGVYETEATCEAQAFIILWGSVMTVGTISVLNLYYAFTIWYGMQEDRFRRYFLPAAILFTTATTLPPCVILLHRDQLNPTPFYPYCSLGTYPFGCDKSVEDSSEDACIRGSMSLEDIIPMNRFMSIALGSMFFILIISMILVVSTVFRTERQAMLFRREVENYVDAQFDEQENTRMYYTITRAVMLQAVMYMAAFALSCMAVDINVDTLKLIFQPLFGFLNCFIFFWGKVYIFRQSDEDITFLQGLSSMVFSPSKVPELILSRMDMLEKSFEVESVVKEAKDKKGNDIQINQWPDASDKMRRVGKSVHKYMSNVVVSNNSSPLPSKNAAEDILCDFSISSRGNLCQPSPRRSILSSFSDVSEYVESP
eukprot:CAMPEP_0194124536 /NCGR_PEP_ID=MMETSP0150-20130528/58921_1 /TAXON_ID=122233 /ORGANISM="Chaetoceros debilis, Strain MM31A-1" /LENGTH=386 /DNA_ID=CAMNT_0038818301 /DNA_START=394 /DNA_END=1554 /DNA_ORIENTATION=+